MSNQAKSNGIPTALNNFNDKPYCHFFIGILLKSVGVYDFDTRI